MTKTIVFLIQRNIQEKLSLVWSVHINRPDQIVTKFQKDKMMEFHKKGRNKIILR